MSQNQPSKVIIFIEHLLCLLYIAHRTVFVHNIPNTNMDVRRLQNVSDSLPTQFPLLVILLVGK